MQTIPSFSGQWRRADSWPNKSELLINTGLRSSMEQLHNHPRESGMKEATHDDAFESPDLVKFSAAMRELTFQPSSSPPRWHTGGHTEALRHLGGHHPAGCPIAGWSRAGRAPSHQVQYLQYRWKGQRSSPSLKPGEPPHGLCSRHPYGYQKTNV